MSYIPGAPGLLLVPVHCVCIQEIDFRPAGFAYTTIPQQALALCESSRRGH